MDSLDKTSLEILAGNFDLEIKDDIKLFREILIQRLTYLINHDFEKLMWILYRIDVDEKSATAILADKQNLHPAESLADVIIQRQIQKAQTRLKYKNKGETDGDY